jgi:hypothetical protein
MNSFWYRYTERRFLLTLGGLIIGTVALFLDKITGGEYVTLVPIVLGVFVTGRVADNFIGPGTKEKSDE